MLKEINGRPVEITRRRNNKRVHLHVKADGRVTVTSPYGVSDSVIVKFVKDNEPWISSRLAEIERKNVEGPGSGLSDEDKRRALKRRVSERLPVIERLTGLKCSGWTIRKMTSRWGSCNTRTHHINLSLMLADKPDELLDYVIVHELVHTRVPNHGPEFKAYMDRFVPEWRSLRRKLNGKED